jgi:polyphosphate kinase
MQAKRKYISSADFMRSKSSRVEVTCPIYDQDIKKELIDNFDIERERKARF